MNNETKVNEAIAELFFDQCMGSYSGHMANIPNNPVLNSICIASGVVNKRDFKKFLIEVSESLNDNF